MRMAGIAVIPFVVTVSACRAGDVHDAGPAVRDSSGIEIVTSTVAAWGDAAPWRIEQEPALVIGDEEQHPLFRVQQVRRLGDGRIVADNGRTTLNYYDPEGRFLQTVGRQGQGPGEFRHIFPVVPLPRDSLLAMDVTLQRAHVFDPDGAFARQIDLQSPVYGYNMPRVLGAFSDGSMLAHAELGTGARDRHVPGYYSQAFVRLSSTGEPLADLGVFRSIECGSGTGSDCPIPAFGPFLVIATAGDAMYYGFGDTYEIRVYSSDGALQRIVRRIFEPLPVTEDAIRAYEDAALARMPESYRSEGRRNFEAMRYPEAMPVFGAILVDPGGNVWVKEYTRVRPSMDRTPPDEPQRWSVFDPGGRFLGSLEFPLGLRVTEIGEDYVLGVHEDDMGVETIRLHRLVRAAG